MSEGTKKTTDGKDVGADKHAATAPDGAKAVADAVKRVADAAVHAVESTPAVGQPRRDFHFRGTSNGGFALKGDGFSSSGTVTVNGQQAVTTGWGDENIEGKMPAGITSGDVEIEVNSGNDKVQRGTFTI